MKHVDIPTPSFTKNQQQEKKLYNIPLMETIFPNMPSLEGDRFSYTFVHKNFRE